MTTSALIASRAAAAIFGQPLVMNVYRSVIVEAIVAEALTDWQWCSADYASYDFRRADGCRLEVKQSAMRQTWVSARAPSPRWDIAPRTGAWDDEQVWVQGHGRNADLYVLALHGVTDGSADHRDPEQWEFYVVAAASLPLQRTLSQVAAHRLALPVRFAELRRAVDTATRPANY